MSVRMEFDRRRGGPLRPAGTADRAGEALRSYTCACGGGKEPGCAFCWRCWVSLPESLKSAMRKRMWEGFEQAYAEAADWLVARRALEGGR